MSDLNVDRIRFSRGHGVLQLGATYPTWVAPPDTLSRGHRFREYGFQRFNVQFGSELVPTPGGSAKKYPNTESVFSRLGDSRQRRPSESQFAAIVSASPAMAKKVSSASRLRSGMALMARMMSRRPGSRLQ